jgi:hypothetical protein
MKQDTQETSKPSTPKTEPEKLSPQDWAKRLGAIGKLSVPYGEPYFKDYRHGMARNIHGWAAYEYHEGGPLLLTLDDYQAALKAAESKPPYKPFKAAMTKYAAEEYRKEAAK